MSRRGRPPLMGQPATSYIRIRVTPDIASELQQVAADNHTSRADVIREAVNEYVSDYRERLVFPRLHLRSCQ